MCTKQQHIKLYEVTDDKTLRRNRWTHCGNSSLFLSEVDGSRRQKVSTDIVELYHLSIGYNQHLLNNVIQQQKIHSSQAYMDHSPRQATFWLIKYTLINLKEQHSQNVCSQTTVELNQKSITKITGKSPNTWRLHNTLLNNTWIKEEISREILKIF